MAIVYIFLLSQFSYIILCLFLLEHKFAIVKYYFGKPDSDVLEIDDFFTNSKTVEKWNFGQRFCQKSNETLQIFLDKQFKDVNIFDFIMCLAMLCSVGHLGPNEAPHFQPTISEILAFISNLSCNLMNGNASQNKTI